MGNACEEMKFSGAERGNLRFSGKLGKIASDEMFWHQAWEIASDEMFWSQESKIASNETLILAPSVGNCS